LARIGGTAWDAVGLGVTTITAQGQTLASTHTLEEALVGVIVPLLEWVIDITGIAIWIDVLISTNGKTGALSARDPHQELTCGTELTKRFKENNIYTAAT